MEIDEVVKFWKESSSKDLEVAESLFKSKHYLYCLFFCHLSLEKALKAGVVKNNNDVIPTHNLVNLAKTTKLSFKNKDFDFFSEVNAFNLKTRYDDYRKEMYKKATKEYTVLYFDKVKLMQKWILKQL